MLHKILDRVGGAISSALARRRIPADKIELYNAIDNNLTLLKGFIALHEDPKTKGVLEYMGALVTTTKPATPHAREVAAVYRDYQLNINGSAKVDERQGFLNSLCEAFKVYKSDHELLQRQFAQLFDNTGKDVSLEQLRVTHAVVIGYIEVVKVVANWAHYLFGNIGLPADLRQPAYQLKYLKDNVETVADAIDTLGRRSRTATILSELAEIKAQGHDVALVVGGVTFDSYADDSSYSPEAQLAMSGFIRHLSTMISDRITLIQQANYRKNKELREWAAEHVALLQLELAKVDPESPEYKRQLTVVEKYTAEISEFDRKIAQYEAV